MAKKKEPEHKFEVHHIDKIEVSGERQRQAFPEINQQELMESIRKHGLINPILCRSVYHEDHNGEKYLSSIILVAGERRLRAIQALNEPYRFGEYTIPAQNIPVILRSYDHEVEWEEAELHENAIRLDLSWQEKTKAIERLHKFLKSQNPDQTPFKTAMAVLDADGVKKGSQSDRITKSLLVADYLEDEDVSGAANLQEAAKIVTRKLEKQAMERLQTAKNMADVKRQEQATARAEARENKEDPFLAGLMGEEEVVSGASDLAFFDDLTIEDSKPSHTFIHGDMQEVLGTLEPGSVNVVITDPPYGQGVEEFNDMGRGVAEHNYSEEDYYELHVALLHHIDELCAPNAHVYIFCDIDFFCELKELFPDGWNVRRKPLIWDKGNVGAMPGGGSGYKPVHEMVLVATRGARPFKEITGDVLKYTGIMGGKKIHAAQKPVALYKFLMDMSCIPGDVVLDPFAGSGTIFTAATEAHVHAIGVEKNEANASYCQIAAEGKKITDDDIPF